MIEMLTQNPDAAIVLSTGLFRSMPLSMVDPRSTKPNKHFPLIFGRRCTCTCMVAIEIQEFCDRSCVYNGYNMYRLDPCSSLLQSQRCAIQSTSLNTTMQLLYKYSRSYRLLEMRIHVPLIFLLFFGHFSVNI